MGPQPLYHTLVDKAEVKACAAGIIGPEHIIPTLGVWERVEDIDFDALPQSFVLKCTHDSGSAVICPDKDALDREGTCAKLRACLEKDFYKVSREWAYKGLRPRIICEPLLPGDISDYKFFCFNGRPQIMYIATGRATAETCFDFYDSEFRHLDLRNGHPNAAVPPSRPENWELMKELSAKLSAGIPHVRVDFYEAGGHVYFGEYTFYHWGGFVPFEPAEWDRKIAEMAR